MNEFKMKKFDMQDYEKYKDLFLNVYGYNLLDEKFKKKNIDNPFLKGDPIIFLLLDGDKVIGANSFFPIEIIVDGKKYLGVQSGDSMILKEYRGRKLFKVILEYAFKGLSELEYKFVVGLPNESSYPGFIKLNFKNVDKLYVYTTILNSKINRRIMENKVLKILSKSGFIDYCLNLFRNKDYSNELYVEKHNGFSKEMLDFIDKNESEKDTRVNNTKEYLVWKYREFNKLKYVIRDKINKKIMAIFLCEISGNGEAAVLDYFVSKNSTYSIKGLLNTLCKYICENERSISELSIWSLNNVDMDCVEKSIAYIKQNKEIYYVYKNLDDNTEFKGLEKLPINKGFSDVV